MREKFQFPKQKKKILLKIFEKKKGGVMGYGFRMGRRRRERCARGFNFCDSAKNRTHRVLNFAVELKKSQSSSVKFCNR